jgi:preprotein translocase subunit SecG
MAILLTIVHYIVCIFLIIVVLLQSGKAADLAGAFGGMGSQTVFGPRGSATVLSKATTIAAILFMFTSLSLSIIATRGTKGGSSVLDKAKAAPTQQKGATPQPGSTVPITVTPVGPNGEKGTPQTIPAPVVPAPAK